MIMQHDVTHDMTTDKPASCLNPAALGKMLQLIYGRFAGQTVCLAAKLGIADHIAAGLTTTADLAAVLDANPSSLRRFLRALASNGILAEDVPDAWRLSPAGELLRQAVPGSVRDLARYRLRVAGVREEGNRTFSVYIRGQRLGGCQAHAHAGQVDSRTC